MSYNKLISCDLIRCVPCVCVPQVAGVALHVNQFVLEFSIMLASELEGKKSVGESVPSTPLQPSMHKQQQQQQQVALLSPTSSLVHLHNELNKKRAVQAFVLCAAYESLYPSSLIIEHSFGDSFYCYDHEGRRVTEDDCVTLARIMRQALDDNLPIVASHRSKVGHVTYN